MDADSLNKKIDGLIKPAKRGDESAWAELIQCLYPTVIAVIRNHLPYSEQEDDLAQDIFVKVFMKIEQYAGKTPLTHWVSRIALNTCYDKLRSQKARRVRSYADLGLEEPELIGRLTAPSSPIPGESWEGSQGTVDLLNRLIATLTADQQMVIRLLDLEEKSVAEVCDLTGWGQSKVKVTAMRARRKLAETLESLESENPESQTESES